MMVWFLRDIFIIQWKNPLEIPYCIELPTFAELKSFNSPVMVSMMMPMFMAMIMDVVLQETILIDLEQ